MLQANIPENVERAKIRERILASALVLVAAVATTASIDLLLPAVPALPSLIGGDPQAAQYVIAAYMGGSSVGLIVFGSLAHRFEPRWLLAWSLIIFAVLSAFAAMSSNIFVLNILRVLQGFASAGAAVLPAPMLRRLFSEAGAVRALSVASSFQSLVPGLAPLVGAWLLQISGWQASFVITGALAAVVGLLVLVKPKLLPLGPPQPPEEKRAGYIGLLRNARFVRYALSHALIVGGMLTFVFSAPYVMSAKMNGSVGSFVVFQMIIVTAYIIASNFAGLLVNRLGAERLLVIGTVLVGLSAVALVIYAFSGGMDAAALLPIMTPAMTGLGLRGGIGFVKALAAAAPDDARGSATLMLAVTALPSIGTALVAPFIQYGLPTLAVGFAATALPAVIVVFALPGLKDEVRRSRSREKAA